MNKHLGRSFADAKLLPALAVVLIILAGSWATLAAGSSAQNESGCPPVQSSPRFTIVYGSYTVHGGHALAGSVVETFSPRGERAGCFVVNSAGSYGSMYVYGRDTTVEPAIPGMLPGETVIFVINGHEATASPALVWFNDQDFHKVNLVVDLSNAATATATSTATSTSTATPTNTATATPTTQSATPTSSSTATTAAPTVTATTSTPTVASTTKATETAATAMATTLTPTATGTVAVTPAPGASPVPSATRVEQYGLFLPLLQLP